MDLQRIIICTSLRKIINCQPLHSPGNSIYPSLNSFQKRLDWLESLQKTGSNSTINNESSDYANTSNTFIWLEQEWKLGTDKSFNNNKLTSKSSKEIDGNIIFICREIACTSTLTGRSCSTAGQCGAKGWTRERSEGWTANTSLRYQARMTKQRPDPQRYVP